MALIDKLNAIGNAIRTKTGGTKKLTLDDMPAEIIGIVSDAETPTQEKEVSISENGTTEIFADNGFVLSRVTVNTQVPDYTEDEDAIVRRNIKHYSNPRVTAVGAQAFYGCTQLRSVVFAEAATIGSNCFRGCTSLQLGEFPKVNTINANAFNGCSALVTLILRDDTVCRLGAATSIAGTPIENGTGYVYVPKILVNEYKGAANWVNVLNQIRAIEDYPEICGDA